MTKGQAEKGIVLVLAIILFLLIWHNFLKRPETHLPPRADGKYEQQTPRALPPGNELPDGIENLLKLQDEHMKRDWGVDPFLSGSELAVLEPVRTQPEDIGFVLKGIAELNGFRAALIETEIVSPGDVIRGWEVVLILESSVIFEKKGRKHEISIHK